MPKIQCSYPGCRAIIDKKDGVRCEKHRVDNNKPKRKKLDHQLNRQGHFIYSTKKWKILSKKKLTVDPFCEKCWKENREVVADVVDHIIEIKDDQSKAYTWSNLQSLCHACHNAKTADEERKRKEAARIKKLNLFVVK